MKFLFFCCIVMLYTRVFGDISNDILESSGGRCARRLFCRHCDFRALLFITWISCPVFAVAAG